MGGRGVIEEVEVIEEISMMVKEKKKKRKTVKKTDIVKIKKKEFKRVIKIILNGKVY